MARRGKCILIPCTGRPKKNGDKIWKDVFHSSLRSIRFQDRLSISLENIGHNSHFEYNKISELIWRTEIFRQ